MIAKIIPLKRLPRQINVLDYLIPDTLTATIRIGQLVSIPFRKSTLYGLVFSLETLDNTTLNKEYKPIEHIVHEEPLISATSLKTLSIISSWYATSLPTIVSMALPPLQKRKLQRIHLTPIAETIPTGTPSLPIYHHYQTEKQHKDALLQTIKGTTLILVPETHHIVDIVALLSEHQDSIVIWHSDRSQKDQFATWFEIRNADKTIIIGTRGSIFLPFPTLDTIIIDFEQKENHKHWDQQPRFHTKDVADLLQKQYGATLHIMSYSPSLETYYHIHKHHYDKTGDVPVLQQKHNQVRVVNMQDDRMSGNTTYLSDITKDAITSSTENIYIHLNRKGFATAMTCRDCSHTISCPICRNPMVYSEQTKQLSCHYCREQALTPLSCPACKSPLMRMSGVGIEQVEQLVKQLISDQDTHIHRIERDTPPEKITTQQREIIIGTDTAFSHVQWDKTDLVIFLDLDQQLSHPEYRTEERVWQRIQDVLYYLKPDGQLLIQTYNPQHLICRSLSEPDRFYRTTLNGRKTLLYPPYSAIVRLFYGHIEQSIAKQTVERLRDQLQTELTKNKKKAILSQALEMSPRYYRRKYWYTIIVRFPTDTWQEDLIWLNGFVPSDWKVDPNPITLLSP